LVKLNCTRPQRRAHLLFDPETAKSKNIIYEVIRRPGAGWAAGLRAVAEEMRVHQIVLTSMFAVLLST